MHSVTKCLPTGMENYYLVLEKGLEKVRFFVSVEVWEPCTYYDTDEVIFVMYRRYILSGFRPKKLDKLLCLQISWEFWNFNVRPKYPKFKQKCIV